MPSKTLPGFLYPLLVVLLSLKLAAAESVQSQRIAILPTFTDFECDTKWRHALGGFDARLQAELLSEWNVDVLSRAGLSAVVFEQKLRASGDAKTPILQVLPADVLVLTVFDFIRQELRVHVSRVQPKMKLDSPKVFHVKLADEITDKLPHDVAEHIAKLIKLGPRQKLTQVEVKTGRKLRCALLEPVSESGQHDQMPKIAPIIRAALEQAVAGDSRGVELVERTKTASLLEEKIVNAANGWNANTASSFGLMAGADLILIPFIHFQKSTRIDTSLFVVEASTGRMLSCRRWAGEALDAPSPLEVKALLDDALTAAARVQREVKKDDAVLRHSEAEFLISLRGQWAGLRQGLATIAEQASRSADSAIALTQDDSKAMSLAVQTYLWNATPSLEYPLREQYQSHERWTIETLELRKSGQLALLHAEARRIFELPLQELANDRSDLQRSRLATLYLRTGEPGKALSTATAGKGGLRELAANDELYQVVAQSLLTLGRYQECVDFVLSRKNFSKFSALMVVDAYRAMGNTHREFALQWINRKTADDSEDRLVRLLALGILENRAKDVLGYVMSYADAWKRNAKLLRVPIIRTRMAAGQKERAISDAQCFMLSAQKEKDEAEQKILTGILTELGAKPLEKLPAVSEIISFPPACCIYLLHDQTIDAKHASEVAAHLAGFWGCKVKVWPMNVDVKKLASYQVLSQAVDCRAFARMLLHVELPNEPTLGVVLLTQTKLTSYEGDVYSASSGGVSVVSDHYFRKYKRSDNRPLPLIDSVAMSALAGVHSALWDESVKTNDDSMTFSPTPPDLFATNGNLVISDRELGISPATAALLKKIGGPALIEAAREQTLSTLKEEISKPAPDALISADITRQMAALTPIIVEPPSMTKP